MENLSILTPKEKVVASLFLNNLPYDIQWAVREEKDKWMKEGILPFHIYDSMDKTKTHIVSTIHSIFAENQDIISEILNRKITSFIEFEDFLMYLDKAFIKAHVSGLSQNGYKFLILAINDIIPVYSLIFDITLKLRGNDSSLVYSSSSGEILRELCDIMESSSEPAVIKICLAEFQKLLQSNTFTKLSPQSITPLSIFYNYARVVKQIGEVNLLEYLNDIAATGERSLIEDIKNASADIVDIDDKINRIGSNLENPSDGQDRLSDDAIDAVIQPCGETAKNLSFDAMRSLVRDVYMLTQDLIRKYLGDDFAAEFDLTEEMIATLIKNKSDFAKIVMKGNMASRYILFRDGRCYVLFRDPVNVSTIYGLSTNSDPYVHNMRSYLTMDIPKDFKVILSYGGFES